MGIAVVDCGLSDGLQNSMADQKKKKKEKKKKNEKENPVSVHRKKKKFWTSHTYDIE